MKLFMDKSRHSLSLLFVLSEDSHKEDAVVVGLKSYVSGPKALFFMQGDLTKFMGFGNEQLSVILFLFSPRVYMLPFSICSLYFIV